MNGRAEQLSGPDAPECCGVLIYTGAGHARRSGRNGAKICANPRGRIGTIKALLSLCRSSTGQPRETGLSGFAVPIQVYSLIGSYVMAPAEHREPYESRGSRTCLGARGGEIPPRDSTKRDPLVDAFMSAFPGSGHQSSIPPFGSVHGAAVITFDIASLSCDQGHHI